MPDQQSDESDEAWIHRTSGKRPQASRPNSSAGQQQQKDKTAVDTLSESHHLNNLPPAILHSIFSHLGPKDLCAVSATCQIWQQLNQDSAANRCVQVNCGAGWRARYIAVFVLLTHMHSPALLPHHHVCLQGVEAVLLCALAWGFQQRRRRCVLAEQVREQDEAGTWGRCGVVWYVWASAVHKQCSKHQTGTLLTHI